jgi:hypothetical protein
LNGEAVKLDFATPISANEAEIRTLIAAAEAVKRFGDPAKTRLCVYGDSQVALGWANRAGQKVFYRPDPDVHAIGDGTVVGDHHRVAEAAHCNDAESP